MVNREDLAWVAGYLDGEGCWTLSSKHLKRGGPNIQVSSIRKENLDRIVDILGIGKVYGPYDHSKYKKNAQPQYAYRAYGFEKVQAITAMLWTWMQPEKKEAATRVLTYTNA